MKKLRLLSSANIQLILYSLSVLLVVIFWFISPESKTLRIISIVLFVATEFTIVKVIWKSNKVTLLLVTHITALVCMIILAAVYIAVSVNEVSTAMYILGYSIIVLALIAITFNLLGMLRTASFKQKIVCYFISSILVIFLFGISYMEVDAKSESDLLLTESGKPASGWSYIDHSISVYYSFPTEDYTSQGPIKWIVHLESMITTIVHVFLIAIALERTDRKTDT